MPGDDCEACIHPEKTCVLSREREVVAESVGYGAQDKPRERAGQSAQCDAAEYGSHGLRGEHTRPPF